MSFQLISIASYSPGSAIRFGHGPGKDHDHGDNCGCGPRKLSPRTVNKGPMKLDSLTFTTKPKDTAEKATVEPEKPVEPKKEDVSAEPASSTSSVKPKRLEKPKPGLWNHIKYYANAFKVWLTELWSGFWADLKLLFKASD